MNVDSEVYEIALTEEYMKTTFGKTFGNISKIYHGKDHWCRCGCGGKYFYPGSRGFARALNTLKRGIRTFKDKVVYFNGEIATYLNVPEADRENKCYCLYFDEAE